LRPFIAKRLTKLQHCRSCESYWREFCRSNGFASIY